MLLLLWWMVSRWMLHSTMRRIGEHAPVVADVSIPRIVMTMMPLVAARSRRWRTVVSMTDIHNMTARTIITTTAIVNEFLTDNNLTNLTDNLTGSTRGRTRCATAAPTSETVVTTRCLRATPH